MAFDVAGHLGAMVRTVEHCAHDGKPARKVIAACDYETDIDDLWDALTNIERIPRWFAPITGELRLGGRYQIKGNAGGEIVACEPPRHFRLTREFAGATSWVTVALSAAGQGTRLDLEHLMPYDETFWGKYGPGAVGVGWELALLALRRGSNEGGEAWALGEEGRNFSRTVADGWRDAAIAAGEDAAAAAVAADNTWAFYTGQPH